MTNLQVNGHQELFSRSIFSAKKPPILQVVNDKFTSKWTINADFLTSGIIFLKYIFSQKPFQAHYAVSGLRKASS